MSGLDQLYQQVILDHARYPHGRGDVEAAASAAGHRTGQSHQVNSTCGDEVTLQVVVDASGTVPTIDAVVWDGQGCSISQASISMLHDLVVGETLSEADRISAEFRQMLNLRGGHPSAESLEALGDAAALSGVGKFPARVKCALLGWSALSDALVRSGAREGATDE